MAAEALLFWAGVIVLVFSVSVAAIRKWIGQQTDNLKAVKDSKEFREILWKWESFLLARGGTVRDVKRFANRARFLTSVRDHGEGGSSVEEEAIVAFVALEQCELLRNCTEDSEFEKWRSDLGGAGLPTGWEDLVTKEQWENYIETVGSSRG